ncbi:MAG: NADH-quinone oxidoreductase subunit C [Actinomycetota bacterium]
MQVESLSSEQWLERARQLRAEGWLLRDLAGLDRLGLEDTGDPEATRFEIVCQLLKSDTGERASVRVRAAGDPPTVASVTPVWGGASFMEREAFDMYGIVFDGHPNLTRILMPDEWEGHPLRKDYGVGKIAIDFKPQPYLQVEGPGQSPDAESAKVEIDALGQVKPRNPSSGESPS